MKKLQNNFTTPEQSKRLLELGVPADSADMYQWNFDTRPYVRELECLEPDWFDRVMNAPGSKTSPVWSVGRLIEIICNCHIITNLFMENWICCDKNTNLIELLIRDIEAYVNVQHMDFSKLEE